MAGFNQAACAESGGVGFFTNLAEYQAHFRDFKIACAIQGQGVFKASIAWLRLPNLLLFQTTEVQPRIACLTLPHNRAFFTFPMQFDPVPIWNGMELGSQDFVFHSMGESFHQLTTGPTRWGVISLTPEYLWRQSAVRLGSPVCVPSTGRIIRAPRTLANQLRNLHAKASKLSQELMSRIAHPQIAKAIEEEIMQLLLSCLDTDRTTDFGHVSRHISIVNKFSKILSCNDQGHLTLSELCALLGTSDRTLRTSCTEILRMGPNQYERIWRLNKVRQDLFACVDQTETIAAIAKRYGFSEPGRFAVQYREMFGETPSATRNRIGHFVKSAEFA